VSVTKEEAMTVTCLNGEEVLAVEENRFSKFATPDGPRFRILEQWVARFHRQGIGACMVKTRSGWAVYRNGLVSEVKA
jgi:hypothetical protein